MYVSGLFLFWMSGGSLSSHKLTLRSTSASEMWTGQGDRFRTIESDDVRGGLWHFVLPFQVSIETVTSWLSSVRSKNSSSNLSATVAEGLAPSLRRAHTDQENLDVAEDVAQQDNEG
jgi:hypothetical protein